MGLGLPLLLRHLAGAKDEAGPAKAVLKRLDPPPVVEFAERNAQLAKATLEQLSSGSFKPFIGLTGPQPGGDGVLELLRPDWLLIARMVPRLVAADIPPPLLAAPDGSPSAHGGSAAAAKHAYERVRGVAVARPRHRPRNEPLPLTDLLYASPDVGRDDCWLLAALLFKLRPLACTTALGDIHGPLLGSVP
jgi:hypothetical protein